MWTAYGRQALAAGAGIWCRSEAGAKTMHLIGGRGNPTSSYVNCTDIDATIHKPDYTLKARLTSESKNLQWGRASACLPDERDE